MNVVVAHECYIAVVVHGSLQCVVLAFNVLSSLEIRLQEAGLEAACVLLWMLLIKALRTEESAPLPLVLSFTMAFPIK